MLKKVVIPVAGRGTRLLPTTKVQPKEMLPVFSSSKGDILPVSYTHLRAHET